MVDFIVKKKLYFLTALSVFLFVPFFVSAQTAFFEPSSLNVQKNSLFSLPLKINTGQNIFGINFDLNFDANLLEYINATEGSFLSSGCNTIMLASPGGSGKIIFGLTRLGASCGGTSGSGTVVTFNFRSLNNDGISNLSFSNNSFCILNGSSCNYVTGTWNSASVTIGNPTVSDTTSPSVPANLAGQAISTNQINLSWGASTDNVGVTGYRIYRNGAQIATASTNSYQAAGLSPSTTYTFAVSAYDAAGNASGQSASVQVTTLSVQPPSPQPVLPAAPVNLRAICGLGGNQAILAWDNISGATSYNLRVDNVRNNSRFCLDGWHCSDPPDKIVNGHLLNSYTTTIIPGQRYNWWVHSVNSVGIGKPSSGSFTCDPYLPPLPPMPPLPPAPPIPGNNQPPVANPDQFSTNQNVNLKIDFSQLLANDSDPNNDEFFIVDIENTKGGWFYFDGYSRRSGKIVFNPFRNFVGQAAFSYEVRDSKGASSLGSVLIDVKANQWPTAAADIFSTSKNQRLIIPVSDLLKNDYSPDGGEIKILDIGQAMGGWVHFKYFSRLSGRIVFVPTRNFTGNASFVYNIRDGLGGKAAGTVTINVGQ